MREKLYCDHGKWWYKGDKPPCKICNSAPKDIDIDKSALRMGGNKPTQK